MPPPIYRKEFWRRLRIDARRARKDPRARKSLLLQLAFLIYILFALLYYSRLFYSFHDPATATLMGLVLLGMIVGAIAVRLSQRREARRITASDIASTPAETTRRIQNLARGLLAITERALGERWLLHNSVPENATVITRRIQLETLRKLGIWDEIPPPVRDWMIAPDGAWPPERIVHTLATAEILNTLLWALALQSSLRPVEDLLDSLSLKKLSTALEKPAPGVRPTWDLRVERDRANRYFSRCHAERVFRHEAEPENEDHESAVTNWMNDITENPQQDYLAGASTIRELSSSDLRMATFSAAYRAITLNLLMQALDGEDVWQQLTDHTYNSLLLPHSSEQTREKTESPD